MALQLACRMRALPGRLSKRLSTQCPPLVVHESVRHALSAGKAVVALESTILTHGMPFPHNLRMARNVQKIISDEGAVPATIALVSGRVHVGLEDSMLSEVAEVANGECVKVSRRDIAYVLNQGCIGGTTISATMLLAHKAGIKLFVSGGLGGVHRGGEVSMDVSADLTELGRTPVALVTSGVKSILDIGRTLEYLETLGVCVATYGSTRQFPAFFTRDSGHSSACNVRDEREAAHLINTTFSMGLNSGLLIANPIPEEYEVYGQCIEKQIQKALSELEQLDIKGRDITPFILKRVNELTDGQSLQSNIALVENNARVGARIAVQLSEIEGDTCSRTDFPTVQHQTTASTERHAEKNDKVTVIGACNMDTLLHVHNDPIEFSGQTNNATSTTQCGGVGRNLCDGLTRLGVETSFLSALGADLSADKMVSSCSHMDWSRVLRLPHSNTAQYTVVLNSEGGVALGVGDMNIHREITPDYIMDHERTLANSALIVMDGNLSVETIATVGQLATTHKIPVFYEPTDTDKATKVFKTKARESITYVKPNIHEFRQIYNCLMGRHMDGLDQDSPDFLSELSELCSDLSSHIPYILVTLGSRGIMLCMRRYAQFNTSLVRSDDSLTVTKSDDKTMCLHMEAASVKQISSVSGAGDCMAVGFMYGQLKCLDVVSSIKLGAMAAALSLQSYENVPECIEQLKSVDMSSV